MTEVVPTPAPTPAQESTPIREWSDQNMDIDGEHPLKEHRKDAGRTKEEIEKLSMDENLGDLDRAKLFIAVDAHRLQQSCALEKLPNMFREYGYSVYETLFSILNENLEQYSPQIQIVLGEAFSNVLKSKTNPKEVSLWLLPTVLQMVNINRSTEVMRIWLEVLCAIIPLLPLKIVVTELLQIAMTKGEVDEVAQSRIVCCQIFGAIAPLLERQDIEQTFLQKAMLLCQDTDAEVRICMCEQLNAIARAIGLETTNKTLLPELYELLKDEEIKVRNAAFEALVQILDFLPSDIKKTNVLPIIRSFITQNEPSTLICVARLFGDMMCKISQDMLDEDIQISIDAYKTLARRLHEEVRQLCAQNLIGVLRAIGVRRYAMSLHVVYLQFVQDPSILVRMKMAASFLEVSKLLGKERTATYLKEPFIILLKDSSHEVLAALFPTLREIFGQFLVTNQQQKGVLYTGLIPALLQAEKSISVSKLWRLQLQLINAFSELIEYLTSEQISEFFVPICFRYMADALLPVKIEATLTLAIYIRNNKKTSQRYEISQKVVREYGHARSYWSRLLYIDYCHNMYKIASTHMFKECCIDAALVVLQDPIPSVRMRACSLLPLLKMSVKLPEDVAYLERVNFFTTQRLNDVNHHVVAITRTLADGLKRATVRSSLLEPYGDFPESQVKFEEVDKQREEEEWNMLSKEEQDEKRKLDEMLQRIKAEAQKKNSASGSIIGGSLSSSARSASGILLRTPSSAEKIGGNIKGRSSNIAGQNSTSSRISLKDRNSVGNKGGVGFGTTFSPSIAPISEASASLGTLSNPSLPQTSSRAGGSPKDLNEPPSQSTSLPTRTSQSKIPIKNPQPAKKS